VATTLSGDLQVVRKRKERVGRTIRLRREKRKAHSPGGGKQRKESSNKRKANRGRNRPRRYGDVYEK